MKGFFIGIVLGAALGAAGSAELSRGAVSQELANVSAADVATAAQSATEIRPAGESKIQSFPRLGGCTIVMRWQGRLKSYFYED